jgi:membrane dipeptidase
VVGVEVAGFAPRTKQHPEASIECLLDHLKYLMKLLGSEHVGAGPDTLWGDHQSLYRNGPIHEIRPRVAKGHYKRLRPSNLTPAHNSAEEVKDLDYVKGLESPSDFTNIARGLVRDGFSDHEITKIMGLNGLRIIKACWPQ